MNLDDFSKQLIEKAILQLDEEGTCNHTGAGTSCPRHGDADCNSSKQNRAEGLMPDELVGTTYEVVMEDGETIIIEKVKMDGKDDNGFKSCWKGYRKVGTKVKGGKEVNDCKKEAWEGSKEDKGEDKKLAKKNKMSLSTWEKSAADKKHDMKKEEVEKKESEKDEGGKHKEYKHAPGKEEKGEKKTEKEMKKEAKDYLPGNQEKLDKNHNGKIDGQDFAILRNKRAKKSVKEMWEKAAEVAEGKKVEIEVMPEVDTPNDPEPPTGKKAKKEVKKEEFEHLEEKKLSAAETAKKEKFVKGMKKKFGSFKSKYGERAKDVMYGTATAMAKKAAK